MQEDKYVVGCAENISVEDERSISTNKKEIQILKKEKKESYQLNASVHTLEVKSEYPTIQNEKNDYITTRISQDGKIGTSKINPNKYDGDIFSFTEFEETMENCETGKKNKDGKRSGSNWYYEYHMDALFIRFYGFYRNAHR